MIINQIIAVFMPSILGLRLCDTLFKIEKNRLKRLETYIILVIFTNLVAYSFMVFVLKTKGFEFTNQFTVKYIILTSVISYILPIVNKFWQSKFRLNIVVKNNEK